MIIEGTGADLPMQTPNCASKTAELSANKTDYAICMQALSAISFVRSDQPQQDLRRLYGQTPPVRCMQKHAFVTAGFAQPLSISALIKFHHDVG